MKPKAEKEHKDPPTRGERQAQCEGTLAGIDKRVGVITGDLEEVKTRCDELRANHAELFNADELDTIAAIKEAVDDFLSAHGETLSAIRQRATELQLAIKQRHTPKRS